MTGTLPQNELHIGQCHRKAHPETDIIRVPVTGIKTASVSTRKINIQVPKYPAHCLITNDHRLAFTLDKRGRDREIEYKTYNKKAKTRERSSSEDDHKDADRLYDKARYGDRDSLRRGLPEKERRFGDWKEMISKGSGKKYYYNERDKSSQWEKPEEWPEYDQYVGQSINSEHIS